MKFGERLIQLRKEKKISQEQLAEDLGVTRQTISNWENYKNYPDIAMLTTISDKYKISLDELLKKDVEYVNEINKKMKWGSKNKTILFISILLALLVMIYLGIKTYYFITVSELLKTDQIVVELEPGDHHFPFMGVIRDEKLKDEYEDNLKYIKYEDLNIPVSQDAIKSESYDSKYFNDKELKPNIISIVDGNTEILVSSNKITFDEKNIKLYEEMTMKGLSADPITATNFIRNNFNRNVSIFTPIKEMKKIIIYLKLLSQIPGNDEEDGNENVIKSTHMLLPVEGPYIANIAPEYALNDKTTILQIVHNNKLYEIKYYGCTYNEVFNKIQFMNFD